MQSAIRLVGACWLGTALMAGGLWAKTNEEHAKELGLSVFVAPAFPVIAKAQGITAAVVNLALEWDERNAPADVMILRATDPSFGNAVLEVATQWRRAPERHGETVDFLELRFEIAGLLVIVGPGSRARAAVEPTTREFHLLGREDLDATPAVLRQPMPAFPAKLRNRAATGQVVVEFLVDENGRVRMPCVREAAQPEFAVEALRALRQWRFEVPRRHGHPVIYREFWAFDFGESAHAHRGGSPSHHGAGE